MRRAPLTLLALLGGVSASLGAQTVRLKAGHANWSTNGTTVTAPFVIGNVTGRAITVVPRVTLPADWHLLMGDAALPVDTTQTAILMVGASVPARTAAGRYTIRVSIADAATGQLLTADSTDVVVAARVAIDVQPGERPGFVVSGRPYAATFVVRNRGNAPAVVRVRGTSSTGVTRTLLDSMVMQPEEARTVTASVQTPVGLQSAVDDVLELTASQSSADSTVITTASARVTVVPEPNRDIDRYLRLPADIKVRAANTDGVSPVEAFGRGLLRDGGSTSMDFLLRGPTGHYAAFGEQDEYRLGFTSRSWRARFGDQIFMLSPLVSSGTEGFGAGADGTSGILSGGAYAQQYRRIAGQPTEAGGFVGVRPIPSTLFTMNVTEHSGDALAGRIGSGSLSWNGSNYSASMELARSSDPNGQAGSAGSARVSGRTLGVSYDAAHVAADSSYVGGLHGSRHDYASASMQASEDASFTATASSNRSDLSRVIGSHYVERFDAGTFGGTFFDRVTLEAAGVERTTSVLALSRHGTQRSIRARTDADVSYATLTFDVEAGRASTDTEPAGGFTDISIAARRLLPAGGVGLYAENYSGGSIVKGAERTLTLGGDATARLGKVTNVSLIAYATHLRDGLDEWHSQLDARVSRTLRNGASLSLRARLIGGGGVSASQQNVAYLEYELPFGIPIAPLRTPGRVYGRVVDAVTGHGVPGALVRLGPQVAITDQQGDVAFGGVPGGEHRLALSQETSFANAVFVGDPTVVVDSTRTRPTTFTLAIARSAQVSISVRRFRAVRTGVAGAPDSLADAGPLAGATLILAGARDTLYRTSSDSGTAAFTDIPPGDWTVLVRGDTPAFYRFDPERVALTLKPGETRPLAFRLVPRRREVQIIGGGQELHPTTGDSRNQGAAAGTTKAVKPNSQQQHGS